ncbi:acyl carrier protein [Streptomyces sp. NPDC090026]|uniref:acyl carrier protein n=1 Tax=Streptomyces sp. NPDC090026 TaxID=3365923 RepID=UPI0038089423
MPAEPPAAATAVPDVLDGDIAAFVVERFLPGVDAEELDPDYDLLATAVIDSLGILHVAAWLEQRYGIVLPDADLAGRNFRTVAAIRAVAERAARGEGGA